MQPTKELYSWADRHGTRELLYQIRSEIPPH